MSKRESFSIAGIATDKKGNTKVKYTNNLNNRLLILYRDGFTNINLIELGNSYEKHEICQLLLSDNRFIDYIDIINNELNRLNKIDDEISRKLQKKQRKLALANLTAENILSEIKT